MSSAVSLVMISKCPSIFCVKGRCASISLLRGCVCRNALSTTMSLIELQNFDKDKVKERASIYVPAIGAVTIAVLLRNLLRIVQNRAEADEERPEAGKETQVNEDDTKKETQAIGIEAEKEVKASRDDTKKGTRANGTEIEKKKASQENQAAAAEEVEVKGDDTNGPEVEVNRGDATKGQTNGTEAEEIEVDGSDAKKGQTNGMEAEKEVGTNGDDAKQETQANAYEAKTSLSGGEAEKEIQVKSSEEQKEARGNAALTVGTETELGPIL